MSSSAVGYVVMSYIMTATPVSMHIIDGLSLMQTKFVIQSHVIVMFLPSLFAPIIVKLFGLSKMMIKDARKLKSFIAYIKQNKISNNTVTTKTISQDRIIDDTLIEFLPSALYAYRLGKNILEYL
jgi:anaerobic C4-dicarboxylate transporter